MPLYSNSPLGLVLSSGSNDINSVGKYINFKSGTASHIKSLFTNDNSYEFNTGGYNSSESDISTSSIIEYTKSIPAMSLKYSDFAYLKNLGVYTNNRLIIARRFSSPVNDDLTTLNTNGLSVLPISTLISWVPDNTEFISTEFGESWTDGEASFTDVLNNIGHDTMMGDNKGKSLGGFLAGGAGKIPLPGFTEGLQYEVFKQLGMSDLDASRVPTGNPNLIRQSKMRSVLGKGSAGSGLDCKFKVEMVVEYEQKFINGVDPTIVYYDIIANALTFGTSDAQFQFKGGDKVTEFDKFIEKLGSGDPEQLKQAMSEFVGAISTAMKAIGNELLAGLTKIKNDIARSTTGKPDEQAKKKEQMTKDKAEESNKEKERYFSFIQKVGTDIIAGVVSKYKIRIMSVVNSLTGSPSAPWHVTIGNPRRPIFSSGDMLVQSVSLTMGKLLAFNDLPSGIKLKFTLESARNLGSQEIYKKFNCGKERTYVKLSKPFDENFISEDITKAQGKQQQRQLSSVLTTGSSYNERSLQSKDAMSTYAPAIAGITGSTFNTDTGNSPLVVTDMSNLPDSLKNNIKTISPDAKNVQFRANGAVFAEDVNGNSKQIGNYILSGSGQDQTASININKIDGSYATSKVSKDGKIT